MTFKVREPVLDVVSCFSDVASFHIKNGLGYAGPVRDLPKEIQVARIRHLREELAELIVGLEDDNRESILDACIDLVYVAIGTAYLHGFDLEEAWKRVQKANMSKIRQKTERSDWDIVKPPGWKAPDLKDLAE